MSQTFEELYPFKSHFLEIDGVRYHYIDEGQGEPIVMLHGNPTWSFYYRNLAKEFRTTHRVIVVDHVGCGFSDKPQDYSYCLGTHVRNLTRFLEHLKLPPFSLVMHDWGGPIGLGYAVEHPEQIRRMLAFNTTFYLTTHYPWRILMCRIPIFGKLAIKGLNFFALAAVYMACKDRSKMTPAVKAGYLKPYNSWANRIANYMFVQDIPLSERHPTWPVGLGIRQKLDVLKGKPLMVCWGGKDFCFDDEFYHAWRREFPEADFHYFKEAGHYVVEDAIEEIIPLARKFIPTTSKLG